MSSKNALFQPKKIIIIIKKINEKSPPNNAMCMSVLQKIHRQIQTVQNMHRNPSPFKNTMCTFTQTCGSDAPKHQYKFSGSAHALPALKVIVNNNVQSLLQLKRKIVLSNECLYLGTSLVPHVTHQVMQTNSIPVKFG